MKQATFQLATILETETPPGTEVETPPGIVLPGHGTGVQEQAINDESYAVNPSGLSLVFSVLGNVIGGSLLIYGLFILPHVFAGLFS